MDDMATTTIKIKKNHWLLFTIPTKKKQTNQMFMIRTCLLNWIFPSFIFVLHLIEFAFCCSALVNEIEYRSMAEKKKANTFIHWPGSIVFLLVFPLVASHSSIHSSRREKERKQKIRTRYKIFTFIASVLSIMRKNVMGFFFWLVCPFCCFCKIYRHQCHSLFQTWIWKTWIKRPSAMTPFSIFIFSFDDFKNIQQKKLI